jgi:hypothetical protein
MRHRQPYARIAQRGVVLVEGGDAVIGDGAALHFEGRVALDVADLVGRNVAGELELTGEQAVHAGRHLGNLDEAQRLDRRAAASSRRCASSTSDVSGLNSRTL